MGTAKRIGRLGVLAAGLGIGAAMAATPGIDFGANGTSPASLPSNAVVPFSGPPPPQAPAAPGAPTQKLTAGTRLNVLNPLGSSTMPCCFRLLAVLVPVGGTKRPSRR